MNALREMLALRRLLPQLRESPAKNDSDRKIREQTREEHNCTFCGEE